MIKDPKLRIPEAVRRGLEKTPAVGGHPAPEVLAALAERALGAEERQHVLAHLAACSGCREVLALAFPEESVALPGAVADAAAGRRSFFLGWGALRWGAAATAVTIVVVVVSLRWEQKSPLPARAPAVVAQVAPAGPAASRSEAAALPGAVEKKGSHANPMGLQKEAALSAKANVRPPSPRGATATVAEPTMAAQVADDITASRSAAPSAPPATNSALERGSGGVGGGFYASTASPNALQEGQADTNQASAASRDQVPQSEGVRAKAVVAPQPVPAASPGAEMGLRQARSLKLPATEWRVYSSQIEKLDTNGDWETIAVSPGARFSSVFYLGSDVWAGADFGRLYHSADNGAHWLKMNLPVLESPGESAIVTSIHFSNSKNGTVIVSFSQQDVNYEQQWRTSDGGEHWSLAAGR